MQLFQSLWAEKNSSVLHFASVHLSGFWTFLCRDHTLWKRCGIITISWKTTCFSSRSARDTRGLGKMRHTVPSETHGVFGNRESGVWRNNRHTFAGIWEWNKKRRAVGAKKANTKYFFNFSAVPTPIILLLGCILERVSPPEFHILTGIVNKKFDELGKCWLAALQCLRCVFYRNLKALLI